MSYSPSGRCFGVWLKNRQRYKNLKTEIRGCKGNRARVTRIGLGGEAKRGKQTARNRDKFVQ